MSSAKTPSTGEVFNAADYLVDRHLREDRGERTAVVASSGTFTYRELADEVHLVAGGLHRYGLRPADPLMLCMADDLELLVAVLAAMYLGAIPVPVSTMITGAELASLLTDCGARMLCGSTEFASPIAAALEQAPNITDAVFDGEAAPRLGSRVSVHHWDVLRSNKPVNGCHPTAPDWPALWLYTSGTTGSPKAAVHRHRSIRAIAENYGTGVLAIGPGDRCLSVAKMFFAYGIGNSCFLPLSVGATTILVRARPTPSIVGERLLSAQPTLFFAVPTFYAALVAADLPSTSFSSVRQAVSAGEPLPETLFTHLRNQFGVEVLDGIGCTETLHIFLSNRPGSARPGSSGVPVPGYEVQLRDEHHTVLDAPGEQGRLYVRGGSIASGYRRRPDATRRVFQRDWLCTGDTYVRNVDGTYTCLGRSSDMLKAGGIWVAPREVEERLLQHPDVVEAAVVGAVDDFGLEKPVACVVIRAGSPFDGDGLVDWCRDGLAAFKRPRAVVAMTELPKTPTGKLRRAELRQRVCDVLLTKSVAAPGSTATGERDI